MLEHAQQLEARTRNTELGTRKSEVSVRAVPVTAHEEAQESGRAAV